MVPQRVAEVPAVFDEVHGEPIEQFGMGGPRTLVAEVTGAFDDAAAENHLPEAVHRDAGGERMIGPDDPFREVEAGGGFTFR